MRKIRRMTTGLALCALLAVGGASAAAKSGAAKQRAITGVVTRVDLRARTIEVREDGSGRAVSLYVPEGETVKTNLSMSPRLPIERLLPGIYIKAGVQ
jgi:hypothetical protein